MSSIGKQYTFWKLLEEVAIEIPIIQRDYAQGRETEKATFIRKELLNKVLQAISGQSKPLTFDFIYGSISEERLSPLDGQQRLTTLFLLHWYLAVKEGKIEEAKEVLSKFSYETRLSSRLFCNKLVQQGISGIAVDEPLLSNSIKDSPWFLLAWEKDPTVSAMLIMLDSIHGIFKNSDNWFEKLKEEKECPVNFQFISLTEYGLTDNLYIKMNARGKLLTEFENLKARLELLLDKKFPDLHKEFSEKVDGQWVDLFWKYKDNWLIDLPFVRFFNYITELCFYQNPANDKKTYPEIQSEDNQLNFDLVDSVYSTRENVTFLIKAIDLFAHNPDTKKFLSDIFSPQTYSEGKVVLFADNTNLFERCIKKGGFDLREKLLLYAIIRAKIQQPNESIESLRDKVRVIRNFLLRVRQRKGIAINPDLRYENIRIRLEDITKIVDSSENIYKALESQLTLETFKDYLNDEREKAKLILARPDLKSVIQKLEDHQCLRGILHNLKPTENIDSLSKICDAVYELWPDNLNKQVSDKIIRSLLSVEDYSIEIGRSQLGARYYFGHKDHWITILTVFQESTKTTLSAFLLDYINTTGVDVNKKLDSIIDNYIQNNVDWNWRYYFVRYESFADSDCIYTWNNDFEIEKITGTTLASYHINPFVEAVASKLNNNGICILNDCYRQDVEETCIRLWNGMRIKCKIDYWEINVYLSSKPIPDDLIEKYSLLPASATYLLYENNLRDRIEIAEDFINDLYSSRTKVYATQKTV